MKKIVLIMLVAMVPFLTMAQKRSKKGDSKLIVTEYMIIKGIELSVSYNDSENDEFNEARREGLGEEELLEIKMIQESNKKSLYIITFDYGNVNNNEVGQMMSEARNIRSMSAATNAAAVNGWEFVSANVLNGSAGITHYYYMKRNK